MKSVLNWVEGARLRTLPAAIAPVLLGNAAAWRLGALRPAFALGTLVVALALQVGVNYANDYSDGIRGSDANRQGPPRLTGGGLATPRQVLSAALISFSVAALTGLALVAASGMWWMVAVGACALVAAWFYTGGKKPYGYAGVGLSEVFVFVFFGLVATVGTTYIQSETAPWWLWVAASGVGLASVALLMVNNVRDVETDEACGKRTIAVRMGPRPARASVAVLLASAVACGAVATIAVAGCLWAAAQVTLLGAAAFACARPVLAGVTGRALAPTLRRVGLFTLAFGVVVGSALAWG